MKITDTQWKIIKELSEGDKTPTELAKSIKITLPSIHNQLTKLKEKDLIKESEKLPGKTRPYSKYSLEKGFVYFIKALPKETGRMFLEVDDYLRLHLRIWSIPQKEYHYYIEKLWWELENYGIEACVVYGSVARGDAKEDSDIDVLILSNKNVNSLQKYNAKLVGKEGSGKMVMVQVFTPEDFRKSLKSGSKFVYEVVNNCKIIYDPNGIFREIKDGLKKKTGR